MANRRRRERNPDVSIGVVGVSIVVVSIIIFIAFLSAVVAIVIDAAGIIHLSPVLVWWSVGVISFEFFVVVPALLFNVHMPSPSEINEERRIDDPMEIRYRRDLLRARINKVELRLIVFLVVLAGVGYLVSYHTSRTVFESLQQQKFGPSETAQVISAVGCLGLAIGTSIAAVIKAYAFFLRARADVIRPKLQLPSGEPPAAIVDHGPSGPKE